MVRYFKALGLASLLVCVLALGSPSTARGDDLAGSQWPVAGHDIRNTRNQDDEHTLRPDTVRFLHPAWTFTTHGDVSATPAVVDGFVYFPDWGGYFHKLTAATGAAVWSKPVADYVSSSTPVISRTGPAVDGSTVYIGTQQGGYILAIDTRTGALKWKTRVDAHPLAVITAAPVVYRDRLYVGVSSQEEGAAADPTYPCCTFRGSMVALNTHTGAVVWKTYTVPDNHGQPGGYSGGAIWGSTAAIDVRRGRLYTATGNNYQIPTAARDCLAHGGSRQTCISPDDHFDSVVALDLQTGAITWAYRTLPADTSTDACLFLPSPNCPPGNGPDFDFGSGPNLITVRAGGGPPRAEPAAAQHEHELVGVGQKSGIYWALDPDTGSPVWQTQVGAGGKLGGIQWGSASDGVRIYVAISDQEGTPYTLKNGTLVHGGSWSALDAATGRILWQVADPSGYIDIGAMTVANGVVYGNSMVQNSTAYPEPLTFPCTGSRTNSLYALDAASGRVLWSYCTGNSVNAGAAIVDGVVYWGTGYGVTGDGYGSTSPPAPTDTGTFYAFSTRRTAH
jgi:polyvinyl alcohol dehydrogenase (cytochrome)